MGDPKSASTSSNTQGIGPLLRHIEDLKSTVARLEAEVQNWGDEYWEQEKEIQEQADEIARLRESYALAIKKPK